MFVLLASGAFSLAPRTLGLANLPFEINGMDGSIGATWDFFFFFFVLYDLAN